MGVLYNNFYKDLHGISSLFTGLPTCLGPTVFYCVHHDLCGVSWYIVQNHFALRREKSAISFFSFFFFFLKQ